MQMGHNCWVWCARSYGCRTVLSLPVWSAGGSAFDQRLTTYLENRRIDLAGFTTDHDTYTAVEYGISEQPALPDLCPSAADDFFGSLLIDLRPNEFQQALSDLTMTTERIQRFLVAPPLDVQNDIEQLSSYIASVDMAIIEASGDKFVEPWRCR